jgi:hypothetical protein
MIKKFAVSGALALCLIAAGCGGGGSSGSGGTTGGTTSGTGPTGATASVSGPLSTVQSTLSDSVLAPLESATAGTPLQSVLVCVDDLVNQNTLSVLNSVLNGLSDPTTLASTTPAQVESLLSEIANNLGALLTSLASTTGNGDCGGAAGTGIPSSNPLAGTPLASLGDALLPVLSQIQSTTGSGSASGLSLSQLTSLFDELSTALQTGMSGVPTSVTSEPMLGGSLTTLLSSLTSLDSLMDAIPASGTSTSGFQSALENLLNVTMVGELTQVVPTGFLQSSGGSSTITTQLESAVASFSATAAAAFAQGESALTTALGSTPLGAVLDPVVSTLLPAIIDPIESALSGVSTSGGGTGVTDLPLGSLLGPLTTALTGLLGGSSSSCVFAGTPLSALCSLL